MNFYQIGELCRCLSKNRGERLPQLESLAESLSNEVYKVGLARDEAVIRIDAAPPSPRIVSQAGCQTAGGCSAESAEFNHRAFAGVNVPRQMIEQLAFFQAEHAQRITSGLCVRSEPGLSSQRAGV